MRSAQIRGGPANCTKNVEGVLQQRTHHVLLIDLEPKKGAKGPSDMCAKAVSLFAVMAGFNSVPTCQGTFITLTKSFFAIKTNSNKPNSAIL